MVSTGILPISHLKQNKSFLRISSPSQAGLVALTIQPKVFGSGMMALRLAKCFTFKPQIRATQIHRLGEPRISSMAARCITTSATGNQMDQAEMNNSLSLLLEWTTVMERLGTTVKTTAVAGDTTSLNTVMMEELLPPLQQASKFSFL